MMEKVRNNIFNLLNKGLRALIYETGLAVQQTQWNDFAALPTVFNRIRETITYSLERAAHVEKTVLTFVPPTEMRLTDNIKMNNSEVKAMAARIDKTLAAFENCYHEMESVWLGIQLTDHFHEFSASCLFFLNAEESALKKILARNYDDSTMCALGRELLCKLNIEVKPMIFKYIIKGTSETEIIRLLNSAKHAAPAAELEQLMILAETELSLKRWMLVEEGLQDGLCL